MIDIKVNKLYLVTLVFLTVIVTLITLRLQKQPTRVGIIDGWANSGVPSNVSKHIYEKGDPQTSEHANIVWNLATKNTSKDSRKIRFYEYAVVKDGGGINPKTLAKALKQADKDHLDIVNLSANFYVEDKDVKRAIEELIHDKTTVVVSAGNIGSGKPQFPANIKGVISVGSKHNNKVSSFSPRQQVSRYADGENIKYKDHIVSGTSFSAPKITNQIIQEKIHNNANAK